MRDFQTKSNAGGVADSINAERFGAGEFNAMAVELENAVESSDQTLAPADGTGEVSTQLAMALAIYGAGGAQYMLDTGAADAYVLNPVSPKEAPPSYFDGFTVTFVPGNVNTGASTVNVNSIGAKSITMPDGTALSAGIISESTTIRYSASNDRFEIIGDSIGIVSVSIITASGAYNPPSGVKALEFIAIGAGGGAGGVAGGGAGTSGVGVAGGGGGASIKHTFVIESSYTITIGAGGSGGAAGNNAGSTGGTTSISSTNVNLSCTGGAGGIGVAGSSSNVANVGAAGGSGSGGDVNIDGNPSSSAVSAIDFYALPISGMSILLGGLRTIISANGTSATIFGAGGGAGAVGATANNYSGGDGADGLVIVKEYF